MSTLIRACAVCAMWAWPGLALARSIDTLTVHVGTAGYEARAFVALPADKGTWPGVAVAHDAWGLDAQMRDVAERLAREGYVAIVPEFFDGSLAKGPEQAIESAAGLDAERVRSVLAAAVTWLRDAPQVGTRKIGVLGFGLGAGHALALAVRDSTIAAVVTFYGTVSDPKALAKLHGPLQAHFGERDEDIPVREVEALRAGLRLSGREADLYLYAAAGHGFMDDTRDSYHPDAARQAWARTLAFLQKQLKG